MPDGYAVVAHHQTQGRGQRNNTWTDVAGKSLLFSVAGRPAASLIQQPLLSFGIAVAIAESLEKMFGLRELSLKWPNDLMLSGRKLGGILIENSLRGSDWQLAVIGVGINLLPTPAGEGFRTPPAFLAAHTPVPIDAAKLVLALQAAIASCITQPLPADLLQRYNNRLYRRGKTQTFETKGSRWQGTVESAMADGRLLVNRDGESRLCLHGHDLWIPEGP